MISLPAAIVPKRFDEARQVLGVFARYVSEGMIPPLQRLLQTSRSTTPSMASLWFVHAAF